MAFADFDKSNHLDPNHDPSGGLPNISFILWKPEPLGTEIKCMACSETGTE